MLYDCELLHGNLFCILQL